MHSYRTGYFLNLSSADRKRLDEEARRAGVSRADVLREGLKLFSSRDTPESKTAPASGK